MLQKMMSFEWTRESRSRWIRKVEAEGVDGQQQSGGIPPSPPDILVPGVSLQGLLMLTADFLISDKFSPKLACPAWSSLAASQGVDRAHADDGALFFVSRLTRKGCVSP